MFETRAASILEMTLHDLNGNNDLQSITKYKVFEKLSCEKWGVHERTNGGIGFYRCLREERTRIRYKYPDGEVFEKMVIAAKARRYAREIARRLQGFDKEIPHLASRLAARPAAEFAAGLFRLFSISQIQFQKSCCIDVINSQK